MTFNSDQTVSDIYAMLEELTAEERSEVLTELNDAYCMHCGSERLATMVVCKCCDDDNGGYNERDTLE